MYESRTYSDSQIAKSLQNKDLSVSIRRVIWATLSACVFFSLRNGHFIFLQLIAVKTLVTGSNRDLWRTEGSAINCSVKRCHTAQGSENPCDMWAQGVMPHMP